MEKTIEELLEENKKLKELLDKKTKQSSIQNDIVIQQSKMASMGEMINNIAHQWRQPLMEVSTLLMNLEAKVKLLDEISNDEVVDTVNKSTEILKYMSHTIDDFRNFFSTNKDKEEFIVSEQVEQAVNIMKSVIKQNDIKVKIVIKNNISFYGCKNEYLQVLINIISNAKDAIVQNSIKNGTIIIKLYKLNSKSIVEIEDNGGGIELEPIQKVFEPFFTYKKKDGTGIGLFMSKYIIEENMDGKLEVSNKNDGVCFKITL